MKCHRKIGASLFIISAIIVSCSSSRHIGNLTQEYLGRADSLFSDSDYEEGRSLMGKSDCYTCHKMDTRLIGPSFRMISDKYEKVSTSLVSKLSDNIKNGTRGTWGNIPMTPHPSLSERKRETIIKFILLTKNKNS